MIDAKGTDAPAILKLIIAVLNGIAFHIDGFAILPPFGRQIVPKPLAPHDEQIGVQLVEDGEKRLGCCLILFRRASLARTAHGHLQIIVESDVVPNPAAFGGRGFVAHQRPLEFQVSVHPAFVFVGRIEIVCHDLLGETSAFGMSPRTTIGASVATIMAFAQHQYPFWEQ